MSTASSTDPVLALAAQCRHRSAGIDLLALVVGPFVNEFNGVHVLAMPW
jgi:hypothetical protein